MWRLPPTLVPFLCVGRPVALLGPYPAEITNPTHIFLRVILHPKWSLHLYLQVSIAQSNKSYYLHALEQLQESFKSFQKFLPEFAGPLCWTANQDIPGGGGVWTVRNCWTRTKCKWSAFPPFTALTRLTAFPPGLLEVSYKTLDPAEFKGLLCGVAFELKSALQVSMSQVINKGADDRGHQILLCDQHPRLWQGQ